MKPEERSALSGIGSRYTEGLKRLNQQLEEKNEDIKNLEYQVEVFKQILSAKFDQIGKLLIPCKKIIDYMRRNVNDYGNNFQLEKLEGLVKLLHVEVDKVE